MRPFFQAQEGQCQGKAVFVENDVSAQGEKAIDTEIRRVMSGCECALFVVGDESHNSPWINREAELAISLGLGRVAVQVKGTSGGLPNALANDDIPLVEWNQRALGEALNKAKRKGPSSR